MSNSINTKTQVLRTLVTSVDTLTSRLNEESKKVQDLRDWQNDTVTPAFTQIKHTVDEYVGVLKTQISNNESTLQQRLDQTQQYIQNVEHYAKNITTWIHDHIGQNNEVLNKAIEVEVQKQLAQFLGEMKTREESLWNIFKAKIDQAMGQFEEHKSILTKENEDLKSKVQTIESQLNQAQQMRLKAEETLIKKEEEYAKAIEEVRALPRAEAELFQKLMGVVEEERKCISHDRTVLLKDHKSYEEERLKTEEERKRWKEERKKIESERLRIEESRLKSEDERIQLKETVMKTLHEERERVDESRNKLAQEILQIEDSLKQYKSERKKMEAQIQQMQESQSLFDETQYRVKENLQKVIEMKEIVENLNLQLEEDLKGLNQEKGILNSELKHLTETLDLSQKELKTLEENRCQWMNQRKILDDDHMKLSNDRLTYKNYLKDVEMLKKDIHQFIVLDKERLRMTPSKSQNDDSFMISSPSSTRTSKGSREWLREIGLEQYASNFESNGLVNVKLCSVIDSDDLDALQIKHMEHRETILKEAAKLMWHGDNSTN